MVQTLDHAALSPHAVVVKRLTLVIVLVGLGVLALVYARLLAQHVTILTVGVNYAMCTDLHEVDTTWKIIGDTCALWRLEALAEGVAVVLFTAAAVAYVSRKEA